MFSSLSEIFMEITVTYNDLVVDQYFTEQKLNPFIHKNHKDEEKNSMSSGEMIFEMLIKCCDVLKIHYDLLLMSDIYQSNGVDKKHTKKIDKHTNRISNVQKDFYKKNVNIRFPTNGGLLMEKIVTIIEETAVGSVACPADNASFALCCPLVAIGTVVDHGVVSNGHIGSVVGRDIDG